MAPPKKHHTDAERKAAALERTRAYAKRHPDRVRAAARRYAEKNKPTILAKSRHAQGVRREQIRADIVAMFGGACQRCGFSDRRALQIDHIHGADEPRGHPLRGGWRLYRKVLTGERSRDGLQLLCANCNAIKLHENREYNDYKARKSQPNPPMPLFQGHP